MSQQTKPGPYCGLTLQELACLLAFIIATGSLVLHVLASGSSTLIPAHFKLREYRRLRHQPRCEPRNDSSTQGVKAWGSTVLVNAPTCGKRVVTQTSAELAADPDELLRLENEMMEFAAQSVRKAESARSLTRTLEAPSGSNHL